MKKSAYISFTIFILLFGCTLHTAWSDDLLTRDQAISILMEQVINQSNNKETLMVFGPQNYLEDGDKVEPNFPDDENEMVNLHNIVSPIWFFYIDDLPNAGFVHPTRFVYIDATNDSPTVGDGVEIEYQEWNPKINEDSSYEDVYKGNTHTDWVYGTFPSTVPIMPTGRPEQLPPSGTL